MRSANESSIDLKTRSEITIRTKSDKLEMEHLKELSLLTAKPFIYVFNVDDTILGSAERQAELRELVAPADCVFLDAKLESDLVELEPEEAREMLEMNGQSGYGTSPAW